MHLGRFGDALSTMDAFLGRNGMQASCWAVHLFVHIQWLNGGLDQVCLQHAAQRAVRMHMQ